MTVVYVKDNHLYAACMTVIMLSNWIFLIPSKTRWKKVKKKNHLKLGYVNEKYFLDSLRGRIVYSYYCMKTQNTEEKKKTAFYHVFVDFNSRHYLEPSTHEPMHSFIFA